VNFGRRPTKGRWISAGHTGTEVDAIRTRANDSVVHKLTQWSISCLIARASSRARDERAGNHAG